ncbi:MAG: hypothetical protein GXO76_12770 [Calditrichaeota bacterium]|nr:hypothetical protein [Calditrichota bacterium]
MNAVKTFTLLILGMTLLNFPAFSQNEQVESRSLRLQKAVSVFDRGFGNMDAGKMKVDGVENFGLLSGWDPPGAQSWYPGAFHGDWGEIRWIAPVISMPAGPWGAQNTNGPPLPEDRSAQYNSIESFSAIHLLSGDGATYTDWEAADNGARYYQGSMTQDNLKLVATSTYPESWPEYYFDSEKGQWIYTPGERHWPGGWARNPDPSSPDYNKPMPGEFVSSKDIFFISTDKYNGIRSGAKTARYGYPVGLDMEVSGYSYSTPLYQNIVFFNINFIFRTKDDLTNPKSKFYDPNRHFYDGTIDSVYFSFFIDPDLPGRYLKPGSNYRQANPWAEDDYAYVFDTDGDGKLDVCIAYDKKGYFTDKTYPQNSGPVSAYGIHFFKTPRVNPGDPNSPQIGITGFHWFDQDDAMRPQPIDAQLEKTFYAISSGRPDLIPPETRSKWFHGDDPNYDDIDLLKDFQEGFPEGSRPDVQFWFSSGPFSISPGDTIPIHLGIVGGNDDPGPLDAQGFGTNPPKVRFKDVFDNLSAADTLYKNNFIGFRPPAAPTLNAVGTPSLDADRLPIIYGQDGKVTLYWDNKAESSYEIITKDYDFEGYRIYKTEADLSGNNQESWGTPIYDISGTKIVGYQPIAQFDKIDRWKGPDPFAPSIDLGNNSGLKYTFVDHDVLNGVRYRYTITAYDHPVLEAGQSSLESSRGNDPRLIQTIDVIPGGQPQGFKPGTVDSSIIHVSGSGTGEISLKVVDPLKLTGHTYQLTFLDSSDTPPFSILDVDANKPVVESDYGVWLESESDVADYRPIFDGVGIKVINQIKTEELDQGWVSVKRDTSDYSFSTLMVTPDSAQCPCDYEIVFGDSTPKFKGMVNAKQVPFQVFNITRDPEKKHPLFIYVRNPRLPWTSGDYIFLLEPDVHHRTWQFSVSWGDSARPPASGDVYRYRVKKRFSPKDVFRFKTEPSGVSEKDVNLDAVRVVPNPYMVYNVAELARPNERTDHHLRFTHLPPKCTIKIYTIDGNLIKTIQHDSPGVGEVIWNMATDENLEISFGVYIYTVATPGGKKKLGKFAVIR